VKPVPELGNNVVPYSHPTNPIGDASKFRLARRYTTHSYSCQLAPERCWRSSEPSHQGSQYAMSKPNFYSPSKGVAGDSYQLSLIALNYNAQQQSRFSKQANAPERTYMHAGTRKHIPSFGNTADRKSRIYNGSRYGVSRILLHTSGTHAMLL
jgi:hypothetical protein